MVGKGYEPLRGNLSRRNGGGLVLSIPFGANNVHEKTEKSSETELVAGIDLNLTTFAVISIDECYRHKNRWKRVNPDRGDLY